MKKYTSMLLALAMVLVLTACGAGAAETSASAGSSPDVSAPAEAAEDNGHAYTAADLEGVVTLDGFGVVQGSVDIDLLAAIDYDNTVVTNVAVDGDGVSYELAKAQAVTYTIAVNKAALDERLGIMSEDGNSDKEIVIEVTRRVPVVAPANCERFLKLNPDMVLLTDGNTAYSPAVDQETDHGDAVANEGGAEVPVEGENGTPSEAADPGTSGAASGDNGSETPSAGSGTGTSGNGNGGSSNPASGAGTSSGGSGSGGNDSGTGSSGGSGSGGNGSDNQHTNTSTPTQTTTPSGSGSGSSNNPQPVHTHTWKDVTEEKWVVDQAAWDEPIYEGRVVCNACGAYFNTSDDALIHTFDAHDGNASYSTTSIQTGTTHHDEVGHYETVVTGYVCSGCGATK